MNDRKWFAGSNGSGRRTWFVLRYREGAASAQEQFEDRRGRLRRFATFRAAKRVADRLNAKNLES